MGDAFDVNMPKATRAELQRFRNAYPREYSAKIDEYLNWRGEHHLDTQQQLSPGADDGKVWDWAVSRSLEYHQNLSNGLPVESGSTHHQEQSQMAAAQAKNEKNRRLTTSARTIQRATESSDKVKTNMTINLPRVVYPYMVSNGGDSTECFRDKDGHRILHVLSARLDPTLADATVYTTALALALDLIFDRSNQEQVTILLDVRPGVGWCNPPALTLVGFIRHAATRLQELYPGRLRRCVLYPIPRPAIFIWNMVKVFLDTSVRSAVCLIPGEAHSTNSPLPRKALLELVDETCLEHCEKTRLATFSSFN